MTPLQGAANEGHSDPPSLQPIPDADIGHAQSAGNGICRKAAHGKALGQPAFGQRDTALQLVFDPAQGRSPFRPDQGFKFRPAFGGGGDGKFGAAELQQATVASVLIAMSNPSAST